MIASRLLVISVKPWKFLFTEEFFCLWGKCCLAAIGFRLTIDDLWVLLSWLGQFLLDRVCYLSTIIVFERNAVQQLT